MFMTDLEFGTPQTGLGTTQSGDERRRSEVEISVIVCTRDRASSLNQFLLSATLLKIPAETSWELLIVDNGSTDSTAEVVVSFMDRLPIQRLWQAEPGLSVARNFGISQAAGKYILWTDDDVLLEREWLAAYREAFMRWPEAAVFGGKVTPLVKEPTPVWFRSALPDLGFLLAARDFGDKPIALAVEGDRLPFGANFAIRADIQQRYPFDPALGVAPGRRRGGEEIAVISAILRSGKEGWWVPDAAVAHVISADRQTTAYISRYYGGMGEQDAFSWLVSHSPPILGAPLATWVKLPIAFLRYRLARLARLNCWVRYFSSYAYHRGALEYWLTPPARRR
jgi:glycosyltransferase involved in cell wall biosynthesis